MGRVYPSSGYNIRLHGPYKAVKEAVPIAEVASRYTTLETFGGRPRYTGRCPLPDHPDNDPSFYIYPNGWYCYGCSRGGDVVDLEFFCGDYGELYEAMLQLAYDFGVDLPEPSEKWREWNGEKARRRRKARDTLARSYQRRYFRVFYGDHLAGIEGAEEREREGRWLFGDLWPLAVASAEYRLYGSPR